MPTGTIKWFNNTKGWGFINPDEGKEDVFIHYSVILSEGYKTLFSGQRVSYSIKMRERGACAAEVTLLTLKKQKKDA